MSTKKEKLFGAAIESSQHLDGKVLKDKKYVEVIPLNKIKPNPYQPRKTYDQEKLLLLGQNIKKHGLDNAIKVIQEGEWFILVSGERRFRASELVGLDTIKAVVEVYDASMMRKKAFWENVLREDLSTYELYEALCEIMEAEKITTYVELAKEVDMKMSKVSSIMSLKKLSEESMKLYRSSDPLVPIRVIEKLVNLDEKTTLKYLKHIIDKKLTRDKALEYIKRQENNIAGTKDNIQTKTKKHLWGESTTTDKKFNLQIKRDKISKEIDKKIQKKLDEIQDILKEIGQ